MKDFLYFIISLLEIFIHLFVLYTLYNKLRDYFRDDTNKDTNTDEIKLGDLAIVETSVSLPNSISSSEVILEVEIIDITKLMAKVKVIDVVFKYSTNILKPSAISTLDGKWFPIVMFDKRQSKSQIRDEKLTKLGI